MSEHNHAYLICDNKCLVEGIPKQDILKITREGIEAVNGDIEINGSDLGINFTDYRVIGFNYIHREGRVQTRLIDDIRNSEKVICQIVEGTNSLSVHMFAPEDFIDTIEIILLKVL